nr:unnamed protein product [Callosobruchus chinensis]
MSQKLIAPGHPVTNGLAERNIQTLKRRLKTASNNPRPLAYKLQDIMLNYRATPLACGKSPAELYLQRRLRIRLDAIKPNITSNYLPPCETVRQFQVGERVQARIHFNNQDTWQFGHILKKLGYRHYIVKLDSGRTIKRHLDKICATSVSKKVTFAPELATRLTLGVPGLPTRPGVIPETHPDAEQTEVPRPPSTPALEPQNVRRSSRTRRHSTYLRDFM